MSVFRSLALVFTAALRLLMILNPRYTAYLKNFLICSISRVSINNILFFFIALTYHSSAQFSFCLNRIICLRSLLVGRPF